MPEVKFEVSVPQANKVMALFEWSGDLSTRVKEVFEKGLEAESPKRPSRPPKPKPDVSTQPTAPVGALHAANGEGA